MGKIDWDNLEITEEWTPLDPADPKAKDKQRERLRLLAKIILEAYFIDKRRKAKRQARKAVDDKFKPCEEGVAT